MLDAILDRAPPSPGTRRVPQTWSVGQHLYHVEDGPYQVHLCTYKVERLTKKGAWLQCVIGTIHAPDRKWVTYQTRWVSCSPTEAKKQALRKRRFHVLMCRRRLLAAEACLRTLTAYEAPESVKG